MQDLFFETQLTIIRYVRSFPHALQAFFCVHAIKRGQKMALGERIKAAAEHFGGQRRLAKSIKPSERALSDYVNEVTSPKISALEEISSVTGVSLVWLITGNGKGPDGLETANKPEPLNQSPIESEIENIVASLKMSGVEFENLNNAVWSVLQPLIDNGVIFIPHYITKKHLTASIAKAYLNNSGKFTIS